MSSEASLERLKSTKRNDVCPCGSGRKYKKCHLAEDEAAMHEATRQASKVASSAADEGGSSGKKKELAPSPAERSQGRQKTQAKGQGQAARPKNLPRRKAV
jgi:hypothetical protein